MSFSIMHSMNGQHTKTENLIEYDERFIHYGFVIGGHVSRFRIKYSDDFIDPSLNPDFFRRIDSLHSITPENLGGFKLGFLINLHLLQYLDFRFQPTVGFYENNLIYRFLNGQQEVQLRDATQVEFPLLFKYKSQRRGNTAMYFIGGVNPQIQVSSKADEDDAVERLESKGFNLAFEMGVGMDIYFPLFKFSPEMRYSFGLSNLLQDDINRFNAGLERLTMHNFTFYVTFEGGPQ
ncbi:MAG TPA: outer membrane beta-barrel protein [Cyclobacteriaceae bacterium]